MTKIPSSVIVIIAVVLAIEAGQFLRRTGTR
jgi:hypothetical protein